MRWTPQTLNEHLRHRRETLGLTQEGAASAIGIYPTNYNEWEANLSLEPHMSKWPGILAFLGYDPICPNPQSLAERIRYLCRHRGLSREGFGKLLGVSGHTVYEWELGRLRPTDARLKVLLDLNH